MYQKLRLAVSYNHLLSADMGISLVGSRIEGCASGTSDVSVTLAICVQPENQRVSEQTQNKREENQTLQFIVDTFGRQIYDIWHL